jgi:hypothetical protein
MVGDKQGQSQVNDADDECSLLVGNNVVGLGG